MRRILVYGIAGLGMLVFGWFISRLIFGFRPDSWLAVLWLLVWAGAAWLSGAALVVAGRKSPDSIWLVCGGLLLAFLALTPPVFHEHEPNPSRIFDDFALLGFLLPQLLPCLALVVVAMLLFIGIRQARLPGQPKSKPGGEPSRQGRNHGRIVVIALALSLLVLVGGLYHLYWLFVWDSTYDALDSIFLIVPLLTALFAASLLAELLTGRLKLVGLAYALLVPGLMIVTYQQAKQVDYRALTEARAERISQALEEHHARQGRYPENLGQLTPWTLLAIPGPLVLYGQDWCYQGNQDSYRLGYVDRQHWSSPELFATVYKTRGASSTMGDLCQAEIKLLKARYPDFYGLSSQ